MLKYEKRDSTDEKYGKRRKQQYIAKYQQQKIQQKQFTIISLVAVLFFFWCIFIIRSDPIHDPPGSDYSDSTKFHQQQTLRRNHNLRDSTERRNHVSSTSESLKYKKTTKRRRTNLDDDDDIGVKSKPLDTAELDKSMAKAIEDLKKYKHQREDSTIIEKHDVEGEGFKVNI
jgi:hypothetical protein